MGIVIFRFTLHKEQINTLYCLFYEQRDLLLLAKTEFGKSLIFQLLLFMTPVAGVILILMPLKLFQIKQSLIINQKLTGKAMVLIGEKNHKHIYLQIAKKDYTYIFTSSRFLF